MMNTKEILEKEISNLARYTLKKFAEILLIRDYEQLDGFELAKSIIEQLLDDENPNHKSNVRYNNIRKELKSIIVENGKKLYENENQFESELKILTSKFKKKEKSLMKNYDQELLSFLSNPANYTPIIK